MATQEKVTHISTGPCNTTVGHLEASDKGKINLNALVRLVGFLTMTDLLHASYDLRFKVNGRLLKE